MTDEQTTPAPESNAPRVADLDAARKARREKKGPPPTIRFLERDWPLPQELPADVVDLVGAMESDFTQVGVAFRVLLGGDTFEEMSAAAKEAKDPLTLDDVVFLLEEALVMYDVTLPKSSSSGAPS